MNRKILLHAVVRYDAYLSGYSGGIPEAVSVVAVVPTKEEALQEVERLNRLNDGGQSIYFWTPAKYYPDGRGLAKEG